MINKTVAVLFGLLLFSVLNVGQSSTTMRLGDLESQRIVAIPNEFASGNCEEARSDVSISEGNCGLMHFDHEESSDDEDSADNDSDDEETGKKTKMTKPVKGHHRCLSFDNYRCHSLEDIEIFLESDFSFKEDINMNVEDVKIPRITELMFKGITSSSIEQFYHVVADKSGPIRVKQTIKGKYIDIYTAAERRFKSEEAQRMVSQISKPALPQIVGSKSEEMNHALQNNYDSLMAVSVKSREMVFKMFQAKANVKDDDIFEYIVTGFDIKDKTIGVAYGFKLIDIKNPRDMFTKLVNAIAKAQSVQIPIVEISQGTATMIKVQYSPMQLDGEAPFHRAKANGDIFGCHHRRVHFNSWVAEMSQEEFVLLLKEADHAIKKVKAEEYKLANKGSKTVTHIALEYSYDAKKMAVKEVKAALVETSEASMFGRGHAPTTPEMREGLPVLRVDTSMPQGSKDSFTLREYVVEVLDQRSSNLCTLCATTSALKMLLPMVTSEIDSNDFLTMTAKIEYGSKDGLSIPEAIASITNVTHGMGIHFEGAHVEPQYSSIRRILTAGIPVIAGFRLPIEMESSLNETLSSTETAMSIHHCMLIVGYDDQKQEYEVLNSWGTQWRNKGFAKISVTSGYLMEAWVVAPINSKIGKKIKMTRERMLPGSDTFGSVVHSWRERTDHFRTMKLAIKSSYRALEINRIFPIYRGVQGQVMPGPIVSTVEGALARVAIRKRPKAIRPNNFIKIFPEANTGEKVVIERLMQILSVGLSERATMYDALDTTAGQIENDGMKHGALMWVRLHRVLERTSKTMSYGSMRMDEISKPILEGGGVLFDEATATEVYETALQLLSFSRVDAQPFMVVEAKKDCRHEVVRLSAIWSRLDGSFYGGEFSSYSVAFMHAEISEEEWRVIVTDDELKKVKFEVIGHIITSSQPPKKTKPTPPPTPPKKTKPTPPPTPPKKTKPTPPPTPPKKTKPTPPPTPPKKTKPTKKPKKCTKKQKHCVTYVIDKSSSTKKQDKNSCSVGDKNGDGKGNTRLDCMLASSISLDEALRKVEMVDGSAVVEFDADGKVVSELRTMSSAEFNSAMTSIQAGHGTDFSEGVDKACSIIKKNKCNADGPPIVVFMSDGLRNRGSNPSKLLQKACPSGTKFFTFAISDDSSCTKGRGDLQKMADVSDATCTEVTDLNTLSKTVEEVLKDALCDD